MLVRGTSLTKCVRWLIAATAKTAFYDETCAFLLMSWGLHYLPFFLMQRQLFLHHYLPALYFAILLFSAVFDFLTSTLRQRWRLVVMAFIVLLAIWNFAIFSPLVYGLPWTKGKCRDAQWLKTWDFSWYVHQLLNTKSFGNPLLSTALTSWRM